MNRTVIEHLAKIRQEVDTIGVDIRALYDHKELRYCTNARVKTETEASIKLALGRLKAVRTELSKAMESFEKT